MADPQTEAANLDSDKTPALHDEFEPSPQVDTEKAQVSYITGQTPVRRRLTHEDDSIPRQKKKVSMSEREMQTWTLKCLAMSWRARVSESRSIKFGLRLCADTDPFQSNTGLCIGGRLLP
jgi:hypothetical protein